jgi:hypothetical protein
MAQADLRKEGGKRTEEKRKEAGKPLSTANGVGRFTGPNPGLFGFGNPW